MAVGIAGHSGVRVLIPSTPNLGILLIDLGASVGSPTRSEAAVATHDELDVLHMTLNFIPVRQYISRDASIRTPD